MWKLVAGVIAIGTEGRAVADIIMMEKKHILRKKNIFLAMKMVKYLSIVSSHQ